MSVLVLVLMLGVGGWGRNGGGDEAVEMESGDFTFANCIGSVNRMAWPEPPNLKIAIR